MQLLHETPKSFTADSTPKATDEHNKSALKTSGASFHSEPASCIVWPSERLANFWRDTTTVQRFLPGVWTKKSSVWRARVLCLRSYSGQQDIRNDPDKFGRFSSWRDFPLNLSKDRWLMEWKSNPTWHMGTPGHQATMEQSQRSGTLGVVMSADLKPSLQCQEAARNTWRTQRHPKRAVGSMRPNDVLSLFKASFRSHLE